MQRDTGALGYPRNHSVVAFSHSCTPNFTPNVVGTEGRDANFEDLINELNHSYYDELRSLQVT